MEPELRLLVAAEPRSLRPIRSALRRLLAELDAPGEVVWDVQLAVNELCTGLLLTAFPADEPPGLLEVTARLEDDAIVVVVTDDGLGFDPSPASEAAEVALSVLERITSGFDVFPSPHGRGSRVELRFRLPPPPRGGRSRADDARRRRPGPR